MNKYSNEYIIQIISNESKKKVWSGNGEVKKHKFNRKV